MEFRNNANGEFFFFFKILIIKVNAFFPVIPRITLNTKS